MNYQEVRKHSPLYISLHYPCKVCYYYILGNKLSVKVMTSTVMQAHDMEFFVKEEMIH